MSTEMDATTEPEVLVASHGQSPGMRGGILYYKGWHPTPTNSHLAQSINTMSLRNPSKAFRKVGSSLKKQSSFVQCYHMDMHCWCLSLLPLNILHKLNSFWALSLR